MKNYYAILGLQPGASEEEIKRAYRDLVQVWHPDRFSHNFRLRKTAEDKLKEINAAYDHLKRSQSGYSQEAKSSDDAEAEAEARRRDAEAARQREAEAEVKRRREAEAARRRAAEAEAARQREAEVEAARRRAERKAKTERERKRPEEAGKTQSKSKMDDLNAWPPIIALSTVVFFIVLGAAVSSSSKNQNESENTSQSAASASTQAVGDTPFHLVEVKSGFTEDSGQPSPVTEVTTIFQYSSQAECEERLNRYKEQASSKCIPDEGQYESLFRYEPSDEWYTVFQFPHNPRGFIETYKLNDSSKHLALKDAFQIVWSRVNNIVTSMANYNPPVLFTPRVVSPQGEVDIATGQLKQPQPNQSATALLIADFNSGDKPNNVGGDFGGWDKDPNDGTQGTQMSFAMDDSQGDASGYSIRLDYDVDSPSAAYNGFWMKLNGVDATAYNTLNFYVKGDAKEGYTKRFKIELQDIARKPSSYLVSGVTDKWQKISIPFEKFSGIETWNALIELVLVFDDVNADPKCGTIYLDQFFLSRE